MLQPTDSADRRRLLSALTIAVVAVLLVVAAAFSAMTGIQYRGQVPLAATAGFQPGQVSGGDLDLNDALSATDGSDDARRKLALGLAAGGKNEEAIEQYRAITALTPGDGESWYRMALLERSIGRQRSCVEHLELALVASPGNPTYTDELARTQMALGEYQEAARLWGSVLADSGLSEKSRENTLILQGQAYQAARDYGNAKKAYAAALKLNLNDPGLRARVKSFD